MTQSAKAQEPSMDEILASIRRIIADGPTKAKGAEPVDPPPHAATQPVTPPPETPGPVWVVSAPPPPRPSAPTMDQDDIDSMLSGLDAPSGKSNGAWMEGTPSDVPEENSPTDVLEENTPSNVPDLTEAMTAPAAREQPPMFRTIEASSDVFSPEESSASAPEASHPQMLDERHRQFAQGGLQRPIISSSTSAAMDAAFNTLAQSILTQNARTLEDLMREMMRPLLKAWLDDNLPSLVERMVRAEIERVSRGHQA